MKRKVFVLSDHTGLTADAMARALLAQFPGTEYEIVSHPFLDTPEKVAHCLAEIAASRDCLVFSSLADPRSRARLRAQCAERLFDFFEDYTPRLEGLLELRANPVTGSLHGIANNRRYQERIRALDFSVIHDDGAVTRNYEEADVILVGVSRSGKTPTCLYLALHYGLRAANYPLVEEDLEKNELADAIAPHREKLVGLTIDPLQLQRIRSQRRSAGRYATLEQCQWEVNQAEALFRRHHIPVIDTTAISIEEIATHITSEILGSSASGAGERRPPDSY